jgi:hypothetical protein
MTPRLPIGIQCAPFPATRQRQTAPRPTSSPPIATCRRGYARLGDLASATATTSTHSVPATKSLKALPARIPWLIGSDADVALHC